MITKFDQTSAIALYKRKFAEYIKTQRFEDALDVLLKYSEITDNPDLHLSLGMLYLLMAQDSDDRELLTMAHRELMLHLRTHPDSAPAYRNLLATVILRRDPASLIECSEWIKKRGYDMDGMLEELAEVGIDVFSDDNDMMYLEALFAPEEFGGIGASVIDKASSEKADEAGEPHGKKPSKIIKFRGGVNSCECDKADGISADKKIIEIENDSENFDTQFLKQIAEFDEEEFEDGDDGNEISIDDIVSEDKRTAEPDAWDKDLPISLRSRIALRNAEEYCENGDYDSALEILDTITTEDKQLHYCAQCVRAFIFLERGQTDKARFAIDAALGVKRKGALAGTLLCALYEATNEVEKIPQALKNIDVTDFIDADHVYKAMRLAINYCAAEDVIELARDYIAEFNVMDIRMLYAQVLYNSGARSEATKELYTLSRIFYDDFNAQYYYLMAKMGVDKMPVKDEAPQSALGKIVDTVIGIVQADAVDGEIVDTEAFRLGLEVFLTLEYQNDKKTVILMFDTLRKLAANVLIEDKMRDALCSPYVEPIVKAVILSALLERNNGFLASIMYCPISDDCVPALGEGYSLGCYIAYAFVLVFGRPNIKRLIELVNELAPQLKSERLCDELIGGGKPQDGKPDIQTAIEVERDIANYLIRTVKKESKRSEFINDDRIDYALGYKSKGAANAAYKAVLQKLKTNKGE